MPLVIVFVSGQVSRDDRAKLDEVVRKAIFDTSRKIGEQDLIPNRYKNFYIVVAESPERIGQWISINIFMLPRTKEIKEAYRSSIERECSIIGFKMFLSRFFDVEDNDWRGSLGDPSAQPE